MKAGSGGALRKKPAGSSRDCAKCNVLSESVKIFVPEQLLPLPCQSADICHASQAKHMAEGSHSGASHGAVPRRTEVSAGAFAGRIRGRLREKEDANISVFPMKKYLMQEQSTSLYCHGLLRPGCCRNTGSALQCCRAPEQRRMRSGRRCLHSLQTWLADETADRRGPALQSRYLYLMNHDVPAGRKQSACSCRDNKGPCPMKHKAEPRYHTGRFAHPSPCGNTATGADRPPKE